MSETLPDYVRANREYWDRVADDWVEMGERAWAMAEPNGWGIWNVPATEVRLLPEDMTGMRAVELGCGTAYISAWMTRLGAEVVAIDNSKKQLDTARRLAREHGLEIELIHGNAEDVPKPSGSFDFAISEYGAAIWADPYKWIPEAHRLLTTSGRLSFLGHHPLTMVVGQRSGEGDLTRELLHPYFGMHRIEWEDEDDPSTEFNLPISEWMRLFDDVGFDVISFHEIRNPDPGAPSKFGVGSDWAHDFPSEQAWVLEKR